MQLTTTLLVSALAALTTATNSKTYSNVWHITDLDAVCAGRDNKECSYLFNIVGDKSPDLPYFSAQCTARSMPDDKNLRPCSINGAGGRYKVNEVNAYLALNPKGENELVVEVKFSKNGKSWWWKAEQEGSYELFHEGGDSFDVIPVYEKGTA